MTVAEIVTIGSKVLSVNKQNVDKLTFQQILKLCATAKLPCIIKFRDISVNSRTNTAENSKRARKKRSKNSNNDDDDSDSEYSLSESGSVNAKKARPFSTRKYSDSDSAALNNDARILDSFSGMAMIKKAEKAEKNQKWRLAIEVLCFVFCILYFVF